MSFSISGTASGTDGNSNPFTVNLMITDQPPVPIGVDVFSNAPTIRLSSIVGWPASIANKTSQVLTQNGSKYDNSGSGGTQGSATNPLITLAKFDNWIIKIEGRTTLAGSASNANENASGPANVSGRAVDGYGNSLDWSTAG